MELASGYGRAELLTALEDLLEVAAGEREIEHWIVRAIPRETARRPAVICITFTRNSAAFPASRPRAHI